MYILDAEAYPRVTGLFDRLAYHLSVLALLQGVIPGEVFVDDPQRPRAAMMVIGHRYVLAGDPGSGDFVQRVAQYFDQTVFPHGRETGGGFGVYFDDGWEQVIEGQILAGHKIYQGPRQYYEFGPHSSLDSDWRTLMPEGFELAEVNAVLLERTELQGLGALREEMCSERPSVEDFLAHSFGYSLLHHNALVTCCLSEYNNGDRCEVGIATAEAFRKRGLATLSGAAFVERALAAGYKRIGWHCWARNEGSVNTAVKIGFEKMKDYKSYFVPFEEEEE